RRAAVASSRRRNPRSPPTTSPDPRKEPPPWLFMRGGATRPAPELSGKCGAAPAGIGFLASRALGERYENGLFMGGARTFLEGGHLFHFKLNNDRTAIQTEDPRLSDRVADNVCKFDDTESESLLFGRNFGVATDLPTGRNGSLFVVSLSNGAIYEVFRPKGSDHVSHN